MVLKLNEICLNFITKNFYLIPNFDNTFLHTTHKENIIERLSNHDLLNRPFQHVPSHEQSNSQISLIKNFFNGSLNCIKFNRCTGLTDSFLKLMTKLSNNLTFSSIYFDKCNQITGKLNSSSRKMIKYTISFIKTKVLVFL